MNLPLASFNPAAEAIQVGLNRGEPAWDRYVCPELGVSFMAPFPMIAEAAPWNSPFVTVAQGNLIHPYIFDVVYVVSRDSAEERPEALARAMEDQWSEDYRLTSTPELVYLKLPGIDEAWATTSIVEDDAGQIGSWWVTLSHGGRVACLGVSYWVNEADGEDAAKRLLKSISALGPQFERALMGA